MPSTRLALLNQVQNLSETETFVKTAANKTGASPNKKTLSKVGFLTLKLKSDTETFTVTHWERKELSSLLQIVTHASNSRFLT